MNLTEQIYMNRAMIAITRLLAHTGMDNRHKRAGFWLDRNGVGVDLNAYLVRECAAFVILAMHHSTIIKKPNF